MSVNWKLHHGDCIEHMAELEENIFDMSVYSPPFPALYAYSSSMGDLGNSEDMAGDMKLHFSFFYRQMVRVLKPGRVMVVHVAQIPRMKRCGGEGLFDFRGFNIRLAERAGFVFEYDWCVRKNPQAQAIRTRSRELQFSGLESDRAKSRGTLPDYLLKFRKPGENAVPIRDGSPVVDADGDRTEPQLSNLDHPKQVSRNEWIKWAECCWDDIKETDTLNTKAAKAEEDTRHVCPLQLPVIERLIRLYSNPGELVFSPFAGIGSEGYSAIKLGRQFYGCELKEEYYQEACKNLHRAEEACAESGRGLFDTFEENPQPANVD